MNSFKFPSISKCIWISFHPYIIPFYLSEKGERNDVNARQAVHWAPYMCHLYLIPSSTWAEHNNYFPSVIFVIHDHWREFKEHRNYKKEEKTTVFSETQNLPLLSTQILTILLRHKLFSFLLSAIFFTLLFPSIYSCSRNSPILAGGSFCVFCLSVFTNFHLFYVNSEFLLLSLYYQTFGDCTWIWTLVFI